MRVSDNIFWVGCFGYGTFTAGYDFIYADASFVPVLVIKRDITFSTPSFFSEHVFWSGIDQLIVSQKLPIGYRAIFIIKTSI